MGNTGRTWFKKGYKQTEEVKRKRSIALKGKSYEEIYGREKAIELKELRKNSWNRIDGNWKLRNKREKIKGKLISHIVWCQANKIHRVPNGCVIHHIDLNPHNDNPENLQLLEDNYHRRLHSQISKMRLGL